MDSLEAELIALLSRVSKSERNCEFCGNSVGWTASVTTQHQSGCPFEALEMALTDAAMYLNHKVREANGGRDESSA